MDLSGLGRNRILISQKFWKFRYSLKQDDQGEDPGITEKWFENGIPSTEEKIKVYVPSTWSYYGNRNKFYHFGTGWYETDFYIPHGWAAGDGKKVTLVFSGVNYKTTVWINGNYVGFHEGGYTKFWFELNKFVNFGGVNRLVIQVDNRYGENRIPWFENQDWMNYGGIYRPVYLKLTNKVCIEDYKISNDITFDKPFGEGYEKANGKLRILYKIQDFRPSKRDFDGSLIITLKNNDDQQTTEVPVRIRKDEVDIIQADFEIENIKLWSPDVPYLYDVIFKLLDNNRQEVDRENKRWGFREFKIHEDKFYLNNSQIVLRGINRHEDHPDVGSSLSPRLIYNDLNIMKNANINCIRTSHYPPYQSLLQLADEMGFLVLEELPLKNMKKEQYTKQYLINAQQQLWEMISRDKNHCSIIAWVIADDCDYQSPEGCDFIKNIMDISRELDSFRYHTFTTDTPLMDECLNLVDFVCANVYVGWYNKYQTSPEECSQIFDKIIERIETDPKVGGCKPLIISEFGAGAINGYKSFEKSHWSENYQYWFLEVYLNSIIDREKISGALVWHFQDFRISPYGGFHNRPKEFNNKGIVDIHRNPKSSYYLVRELYDKWQKKIQNIED